MRVLIFCRIIFSVLLFSPGLITAQGFKAGLMLGLATTQVDGDGYAGYDKPGLTAGAFVNRSFGDRWSGEMEIYYVEKGSRHTPKPDYGDYTFFKMSLNYVEVPLLIRTQMGKFLFDGGPSLAFLLNYGVEDANGPEEIQTPFKQIDFCSNIGVSYQLLSKLSLNWRFQYSMIPIRTMADLNSYRGLRKQWNDVLSFTLHYQF